MKSQKCFFYEKQLYLYREGELSERERERLEKHLAVCPECAAAAQKLKSMELSINRARKGALEPDNSAALTNSILFAVSSLEKYGKYRRDDRTNNLLNYLFSPRLRYALSAVIVLIVCLFFIQEALLMGRIARLERRISATTAPGIITTEKKLASELESRMFLLEKSNLFRANNFSADNNKIIVDEKTLNALLQDYKSVKIQNEILLQLLKNKNPDLYDKTTQKGLNQAEIKELLRNKREIIQLFKEL